jgi:hypothetical protein
MEALQKEMFNIGIAFEVLEDGASAPKGTRSLVTLYGTSMIAQCSANHLAHLHIIPMRQQNFSTDHLSMQRLLIEDLAS